MNDLKILMQILNPLKDLIGGIFNNYLINFSCLFKNGIKCPLIHIFKDDFELPFCIEGAVVLYNILGIARKERLYFPNELLLEMFVTIELDFLDFFFF